MLVAVRGLRGLLRDFSLLEVGGWKLEVGSWKLEVGGWKLEVEDGGIDDLIDVNISGKHSHCVSFFYDT